VVGHGFAKFVTEEMAGLSRGMKVGQRAIGKVVIPFLQAHVWGATALPPAVRSLLELRRRSSFWAYLLRRPTKGSGYSLRRQRRIFQIGADDPPGSHQRRLDNAHTGQ
jgi:hypothetical protein